MQQGKSLDNETGTDYGLIVLHRRRMEEVRKNFAVGIQRIVADKIINRGHRLKTRQRNNA